MRCVLRTSVALLLIMGLLAPASGEDAETETKLNSTLDAWRRAAKDYSTLRADVTRWTYRHVMDQPSTCQGTLYFGRPNVGRLELRPSKNSDIEQVNVRGKNYRLDTRDPETMVWLNEEFLVVEPLAGTYFRWNRKDLVRNLLQFQKSVGEDAGWFNAFSLGITNHLVALSSPDQAIPFLVGDAPDATQERFKLSLLDTEELVCIRAIPNLPKDKTRFDQILILISPDTHLPYATRVIGIGGNVVTTTQLINVQLNVPRLEPSSLIPDGLDELKNVTPALR